MSQLVVRPGRNAAREAKRLKEVRHVKGAIAWTERERVKRQKLFQERFESKQAVLQLQKWKNENIKKVRKQALANAKEDWQLGPLRPNRAVGMDKDKYGALTGEQAQKPEIPVHTQRNRNEARAKRGLELQYPLVVDDKKYFHIAKDDRVVVIKGREKGKIGVVQSIVGRTHDVIVAGINMQYFDASMFGNVEEDSSAKRKTEAPMPIDDVRLVVPYEIIQEKTVIEDGEEVELPVKLYTDVIVDKVFMERHTTGIDPFTGTDYGDAEIPKEHQYDPHTGLPIFRRYIAGTRQEIEWPWEREEEIEDSGITEGDKTDSQTFVRKTLGAIRHPIQSLKRWRTKDTKAVTEVKEREEALDEGLARIEQEVMETRKSEKPRSQDPRYYDAFDNTDTTRNIVEAGENMRYQLLNSPLPPTLGEELRAHIQSFGAESRKKDNEDGTPGTKKIKRTTERSVMMSEIAKAKHAAAQQMKTPMQLRWETEHAKKIKQQKIAPLVSTDELMKALDAHILQKKASTKVQELD